ncbi:MAG: hypothetical protein LBG80_11150 [Bacteroidales bacterium]|jgi:prophage antirepressor-like protein|nr:hypothetical protein [Bacteroidales bacterium]
MEDIQNKKLCLVVSAGVTVNLLPDDKHEFLMAAQEVAKGYDVTIAVIQDSVRRHVMEFIEGKHFIHSPEDVMWTKRGVVRLGFFIDGPKARAFRDMIEDLKLSPTPESSDTFTFPATNHPVRIVMINKEPWFVGKDVAKILGYTNTDQAIRQHVDDEDKTIFQLSDIQDPFKTKGSIPSHMKGSKIVLIAESGVYALIFGSTLPKAKEFKRWVTSEVLPAIRRTGKYTPEIMENDCPYTKDFTETFPAIDTRGLLLDIMDDICHIEDYSLRTCIAAKIKALRNIDIH